MVPDVALPPAARGADAERVLAGTEEGDDELRRVDDEVGEALSRGVCHDGLPRRRPYHRLVAMSNPVPQRADQSF
jgi:hypothetical protein